MTKAETSPEEKVLPYKIDKVSYNAGVLSRKKEEIIFLDKILRLPFFEFCLQVKERKLALEKE